MGAQELLSKAIIQTDRQGWARRSHLEFDGENVLALEVNGNDLVDAADRLDHWAMARGGDIVEVQHVMRRGKRVVYGRVQR